VHGFLFSVLQGSNFKTPHTFSLKESRPWECLHQDYYKNGKFGTEVRTAAATSGDRPLDAELPQSYRLSEPLIVRNILFSSLIEATKEVRQRHYCSVISGPENGWERRSLRNRAYILQRTKNV
jgi:hypothetical protein